MADNLRDSLFIAADLCNTPDLLPPWHEEFDSSHYRLSEEICMSQAALLVHRGARIVTREELERVQAPPPTDTWFPLPHDQVLDRTLVTLKQAGFEPT